MTTRTVSTCDVCRRELPVLGNRCESGDTAVYRVKRTTWRFFSQRLSWAPDREEWEELCGDCWTELTSLVRDRIEKAAANGR